MIDAQVHSVIRDVEAFMAGVDDALALPRDAASFGHALVLARGARRAVEIGTSYGYSGLWIAAALARTGGTLITIDHDRRKSVAAREYFLRAGLLDRVELRTGPAIDELRRLDGPVDFVLNDADKANCRAYVETLESHLLPGAIVLTDNVVTHADELHGFLQWIRSRSDFFSTPVPIGSGMELSVWLPTGGCSG